MFSAVIAIFLGLAVDAAVVPASGTSNICQAISKQIGGGVYYPFTVSQNYLSDISHYMSSSTEQAACVVEVSSTADIAVVMKAVAASRTPFGVKSGGHASNPGFSSTSGILISLTRLKKVELSADKKSVTIGMGNGWVDVYKALDGSGRGVVGGRVSGPGVGGFTLGGGYSWLTDQHGLTCDTTISYTLVLPSGDITTVDATTPDLFFALKGGLNRFGVVSEIVYQTFDLPQQIYGGIQIFGPEALPALIKATNDFQSNNQDEKAQVILTINAGIASGAILLSYYHGATRPAAFSGYNGIQPLISTLKTQSFYSFVSSVPSQAAANARGAFHTVSTTDLTENFIKAVYNESTFYGALAATHTGVLLSYDVEPFMKYGSKATDSAFPHADSPLPLNLYFSWLLPTEDTYWRSIMQQSIAYLTEVAKREGIYSPNLYAYPNYALSTYSWSQIYGPTNAARLKIIQKQYDPNNVMGLAGGFQG